MHFLRKNNQVKKETTSSNYNKKAEAKNNYMKNKCTFCLQISMSKLGRIIYLKHSKVEQLFPTLISPHHRYMNQKITTYHVNFFAINRKDRRTMKNSASIVFAFSFQTIYSLLYEFSEVSMRTCNISLE